MFLWQPYETNQSVLSCYGLNTNKTSYKETKKNSSKVQNYPNLLNSVNLDPDHRSGWKLAQKFCWSVQCQKFCCSNKPSFWLFIWNKLRFFWQECRGISQCPACLKRLLSEASTTTAAVIVYHNTQPSPTLHL